MSYERAGDIGRLEASGGIDHAVGISLLFCGGARPDADALRALAESSGNFAISHDPGSRSDAAPHSSQAGSRWVEVLADGLTFDLSGLSPGAGHPSPGCIYPFDLPASFDGLATEALRLLPGPHLSGGERMMPVIRAMAGLAASLCALPGLAAVAWHPARSCIGPRYFTSIIGNWLEGGVFPGLGLVGLSTVADGGIQSEGLAFFTSQELRIEPELTEDRAAAAKIAVRLIDRFVEQGPLSSPDEVAGPEGRSLRVEPSANGRFVRVWAGAN